MMIVRSAALIALIASLPGCAYKGPAASGESVRAIVASQVLPPQPHRETGADGSSAAAAYANYQQSFAVPTAQSDSPIVGKK